MVKANKVKIRVIKMMSEQDVFGDEPPTAIEESFEAICPRLKKGQEFIVPADGNCPEGFCGWAFADIQRDITHLRFEGSYPHIKDSKLGIACCTDGLRPVFFKLERIEE